MLLPIVACLAVASSTRATDCYLKEGDRVLFYGDSITAQLHYGNYIEAYLLGRYPELQLRFTNVGWPGDTVFGGAAGSMPMRVERDIRPFRPTLITVMLGMNDGRYSNFSESVNREFENGYADLLNKINQRISGARLTLIMTSPYDSITKNTEITRPWMTSTYNDALLQYGEVVNSLSQKRGAMFVDLNRPILGYLERAKQLDPDLAQHIIPDSVHPNPAGHLLMAAELLRAWRADRPVSEVEIDAIGPVITKKENTVVTPVVNLSWLQIDQSLPFAVPGDPVTKFALRCSDFGERFNRQILRIINLEPAVYTLKIDQKVIASFTHRELAKGINLSELDTPMMEQARRLMNLTVRRNNAEQTRWKNIQLGLAGEKGLRRLLEAMDKVIEGVYEQQLEVARPVPHKFQLVRDRLESIPEAKKEKPLDNTAG